MQSNTLAARPLLRVLAAVLAAAAAPAAAQSAATPNYSGYTTARFIPFAPAPPADTACRRPGTPPFTCTAGLYASIGGNRVRYTMDTGTTGIMVSASQIPGYRRDWAAQYPSGWEFLSSSNILWVGNWIPMDVTFQDSAGVPLVARVPVLAVHSETICEQYAFASGPSCPPQGTFTGSPLRPASPGIFYMGVGFGRENDGQPQGTPEKNPLLNVTHVGGVPVAPGTLRSGYIITATGVHVGLTAANTSGFVYTPLAPMSGRPMDWSAAPMCVQVNGSRCMPGSALIDTGINTMYISTPVPVSIDSIKDPSDPLKTVPALAGGTRVTVRFPADTGQVAFYSFVVGDTTNTLQPYRAIRAADPYVFVNTGRHFYRAFNVLYDAAGGYFGLRWIGGPGSSNGGVTPGGN